MLYLALQRNRATVTTVRKFSFTFACTRFTHYSSRVKVRTRCSTFLDYCRCNIVLPHDKVTRIDNILTFYFILASASIHVGRHLEQPLFCS